MKFTLTPPRCLPYLSTPKGIIKQRISARHIKNTQDVCPGCRKRTKRRNRVKSPQREQTIVARWQ